MNPWLVFGAAGGITWVLRVMFIDVFPARKLPPSIRTALEAGGPAAMAALLTSEFVHIGIDPPALGAALAGTLAAAFVTYRYGNLAATAVVGIAIYWLVSIII